MKFKSLSTVSAVLLCISTFSLIGCNGNGGDNNPVSSNSTNDQPASTLSSTPTITNLVINNVSSPDIALPPFSESVLEYSGTYDFTDAEGDITGAIIRIEGPWGAVTQDISGSADIVPDPGTTSGKVSFSRIVGVQLDEFGLPPLSGLHTMRLALRDSQGNISNEVTTTFSVP